MNLDVGKFKKLLLNLKEDMLRVGNSSIDVLTGERLSDDIDTANADIQASLTTKLISRKAAYLKRINKSLKQIDEGTYGECDSCGQGISEKRLLVRPTAILCIECKEEQEKEEKREKDKLKGGFLSEWE